MKHIITIFAILFFAPSFVFASTPVSGTLVGDQHWTIGNSPYLVGYTTISEGATLTIDPGVIVKLGSSGTQIVVSGTLKAEGTPDDPINFTSSADDSLGGDTNLDSTATSPKEGDWDKIAITGTGVATIKNAVIRYGGFACCWTPMIMTNIYNNGGTLTIENSTVGFSSGNGIQHNGGTTIISGSQFNNNKSSGISASGTGSLTFTGNTFSGNTGNAVYTDTNGGLVITNSNNSGSNGINLNGTMNADQTLLSDGLPYLISYFTIPEGKTLTVSPGAVIKFLSTGSQLVVSGNLNAEGTSDKQIYFTSINDNEVGGATGTGTPKPADWDKINISSTGKVNLKYSVVRFGGFACCWTPMIRANIYNNGGTLNISNSAVSLSDGNGIEHSGGTTSAIENTIANNSGSGISARGGGSLSFTDNTFSGNVGDSVYAELSGGVSLSNSGNTGTGGINLYGTMTSDQTLVSDGIPYIISYLSVPVGKTLTFQNGSVIKFKQGSVLSVGGTLNAHGTNDHKIYFTSIKDDGISGDTNGDGITTNASPADWDKISISSSGTANFTYSVVRFGGFACCWTPMIHANIYNNGGTLNVSSSTVSFSDGNGIQHNGGMTSISGSTINGNSGNGVSADGAGTLSVTGNSFSDNQNGVAYLEFSSGLIFSNANNTANGSGVRGFIVRGNMNSDQTWTKDNLPYVISYFVVSSGKTLTIQPGAVIKFNPSSVLNVNGTLNAVGTDTNRIYFTSLKDDDIGGDTNTDGHTTTPAPADWDKIAIAGGIANFDHTVIRYGGFACCWTPMIRANVYNNGGTLSVQNSFVGYSDGNGIEHANGTTTVNYSTIWHNSGFGVYNSSAKNIDAKNNFWGSSAGPNYPGSGVGAILNDKISAYVDYLPWLDYDPTKTAPPCVTNCYSNVMFLPGIMGSNLYNGTGKEIWLSDNDTEADYLRMDENGASVNSDISTKNAMATAGWNRLDVNIYKSFLAEMRDWETAYGITATTTPYDWRLDYDTVVSNGRKLSNGNISYLVPPTTGEDPYIIATLKKLASTSKTGKVTIIAHSQGGLITKALTTKLGADASKYIDKIIFVATPQLGTPQAFAQIMNGTGADITNVISAQESRFLAQNMQSAYNLLPSAKYFTYVDDPVAIISTTTLSSWVSAYGEKIHWDQGMYNFMADIASTRTKPSVSDLTTPEISNPVFLNRAKAVHDSMDNWIPPTGVKFVTVAGWGNETLWRLEYNGIPSCASSELYQDNGKTKARCVKWGETSSTPTPKYVIDGDGTVVEPSAQFANGVESIRYWVNLPEYNTNWHVDRDHKNILEIDELRELLKNVLTDGAATFPNQYISTVAPKYTGAGKRLHFILHSPLTLEFYDTLGNHVGYSATTSRIDRDIPGVDYKQYGEVQWLSVPESISGRLVMNGISNGSFTLDVENADGNQLTSKTSFEGIPSLASTVVSMDISPSQDIPSSGTLMLDYDGNGTNDLSLQAKENGVVMVKDDTHPSTAVAKTGTIGLNGWYVTDVSVSLNATDTESGVKNTFYSQNGGEMRIYVGLPINISSEGTTTISYYSIDNDGNIEATSTLIVKIDKTAPEAKIAVDPATKELKIEGTDVNTVVVTKGTNDYTITDEAGNTTKLFFQKTYSGKILTYAKFTAIQYGNGSKIVTPSSSFLYVWLLNNLVSQTIAVNDTYAIEALYEKTKNQTTVFLKKKGVQVQKQTFSGLRIPKLTTMKGTVSYEL